MKRYEHIHTEEVKTLAEWRKLVTEKEWPEFKKNYLYEEGFFNETAEDFKYYMHGDTAEVMELGGWKMYAHEEDMSFAEVKSHLFEVEKDSRGFWIEVWEGRDDLEFKNEELF